MKFKQTKELIHHAASMHTMMGKHFSDESARTEDERLKLLLNYLTDHQQALAARLIEYGKEAPNKILDMWFQFNDCEVRFHKIMETLENDETTVEEVIDKTIRLYDCIITHFEDFAKRCDTDELEDVLKCIARLEEKDKLKIVRNAHMLEDL